MTETRFTLQIPVFRGSGSPLVTGSCLINDHFGGDGLGDVITDKDPHWEGKIQKEHAVNAMIRLVSENQKKVRYSLLSSAAPLWWCAAKT